MDSARYIRSYPVMLTWIVAPLVLVAVIGLAAYNFHEHTHVRLLRSQALEKMIPAMQQEADRYQRFLKDYSIRDRNGLPVEDAYIAMLNNAAENVSFTVTSIQLVQDETKKGSNVHRIKMHIEGFGKEQSVMAFLNNIRAVDKLIYEDRVVLSPLLDRSGMFNIEADLSKVYLEGGTP